MLKLITQVVILGATSAIGACSQDFITTNNQAAPTSDHPITSDDRRAAKILSVGNGDELSATTDPLDRALTCSIALTALKDQIRVAQNFSADQAKAFNVAEQIFARRIREEAAKLARPPDQVAIARRKKTQELYDANSSAMLSIGCLRSLT